MSRKRAFFIDTLKRSPEIDANVRTFSCHSSNVISRGVSSEGSLHTEDCAHETLCSRRCVWSVPRDQHSPCKCSVHVCDSSDRCQRWFPHVHHLDLEEFLGRYRAIFCESGSDSRHTDVWARRGRVDNRDTVETDHNLPVQLK